MRHDPVTDLIRRLRHEADAADFSLLAAGVLVSPEPRVGLLSRLRARAATAVAASVVAVGGLTGVAYASNGAVPGDVLYGLDRALESVGIGNGGAAERIAEAIDLVSGGNPGQGLEHAATLVPDDAGAEAAVFEAAAGLGPAEPAAVQEDVLALLAYLRDNVGDIDGQTVADFARAIGGQPEEPPVGGPPEDVPAGPPDSTPGGGTPPDDPSGSHGPPDSIPPTTTTVP